MADFSGTAPYEVVATHRTRRYQFLVKLVHVFAPVTSTTLPE
jgi:hypothetical protein